MIANVPGGGPSSHAPQGNSVQPLTCSFTDAQPLPGVNYYRLTQTDFDGICTLRKIIALSREGGTASRQQPALYPNPVGTLGEATLEPALPHRAIVMNTIDWTAQTRQTVGQRLAGSTSRLRFTTGKLRSLLRLYS